MKAQIAVNIICPKCQNFMLQHCSLTGFYVNPEEAKFYRVSCRDKSCELFDVKFKLPTVELELEKE